jgi:hypothetical protein
MGCKYILLDERGIGMCYSANADFSRCSDDDGGIGLHLNSGENVSCSYYIETPLKGKRNELAIN